MVESLGDECPGRGMVAAFALVDVFEDCYAFLWLDAALEDPVALRLTSSRFIIVYAPARRWTCLAEISSVGSSPFIRKWRMGWAHDGAVTCSITKTATATRAGGLGSEELESAAAWCVGAVPGTLQ